MTVIDGTLYQEGPSSFTIRIVKHNIIAKGYTREEVQTVALANLRSIIQTNRLEEEFPEPIELNLQEAS